MNPKKGDMFACTQGTYIGSNLILINEQDKVYNFLNVPDMKNVEIPIDEVKLGVENDILDGKIDNFLENSLTIKDN